MIFEHRRARRALILLLALSGCVAEVSTPESCAAPASLVSAVNTPPSSTAAMEDALRHAAGPMANALGTEEQVERLRSAMLNAAGRVHEDADASCRLLTTAMNLLDSLPNNPATLPDRDGIRMVLALTAKSLATSATETP